MSEAVTELRPTVGHVPVSSLIFVVIVAIWAAYLVQHWPAAARMRPPRVPSTASPRPCGFSRSVPCCRPPSSARPAPTRMPSSPPASAAPPSTSSAPCLRAVGADPRRSSPDAGSGSSRPRFPRADTAATTPTTTSLPTPPRWTACPSQRARRAAGHSPAPGVPRVPRVTPRPGRRWPAPAPCGSAPRRRRVAARLHRADRHRCPHVDLDPVRRAHRRGRARVAAGGGAGRPRAHRRRHGRVLRAA